MDDTEHPRWRRRIQEAAIESLSKEGKFSFKLEPEDAKRVYKVANLLKRHTSTLLKQYVLYMLEEDERMIEMICGVPIADIDPDKVVYEKRAD